MYYEIESQLHMNKIVFDNEGFSVGDRFYPYGEIEKIEIKKGPLFATYGMLHLWTGGKETLIPFPKSAAEKIRGALREMERMRAGAGPSMTENREEKDETRPGKGNPAMDPYEEAKKLKELLDLGIITEEEFQRKKKEILGL